MSTGHWYGVEPPLVATPTICPDLDLLVDLHTGVLASDTRSEVYQYMSRYTDYTSTPHTCTSIHLVCMVYTVMVGVIHVYTYMYGGVRLVVYL